MYRVERSLGIRIGMLADDIVFWSSNIDVTEIELKLNITLTALLNFAAVLKSCFNPSKSVATFIFLKRSIFTNTS